MTRLPLVAAAIKPQFGTSLSQVAATLAEEDYRCNRRVEIRVAPVTQADANAAGQ